MAIGPTAGLPSLVLSAVALLLTVPQVAPVVGLVTWTWTEAPAARDAGPKPRTPPAIVQPGLEPARVDAPGEPRRRRRQRVADGEPGDRAGAVVGDGDDVADRAAALT